MPSVAASASAASVGAATMAVGAATDVPGSAVVSVLAAGSPGVLLHQHLQDRLDNLTSIPFF